MFGPHRTRDDLAAEVASLERTLADQRARLDDRARRLEELGALRSELESAKREITQLAGVIRKVTHKYFAPLPMPPESLRLHVGTRTSDANFWWQGLNSSERVLGVFGDAPPAPILDWGCGCGRTLRWLQRSPAWRAHYHGCDVDAEAIAWLAANGVPNVAVCGDSPPLPYAAGTFAGVFAFSVLTHIHPAKHRDWFAELHRVLTPGGTAYLTTQGPSILADASAAVAEGNRREFREQGCTYVRHEGHYKDAAFVSQSYTAGLLAGLFTVESYTERGYQNMDAFLVRRIG
jgi:SAM-dependent methyltransferase